MNQEEELKLAFMGYVMATKKQPKSQEEINQILTALMQLKQQNPEQYAQLVQMGQQIPANKYGAKVQYIKKLKGICPEGQELSYMAKGGKVISICKPCMMNKKGKKMLKKKC